MGFAGAVVRPTRKHQAGPRGGCWGRWSEAGTAVGGERVPAGRGQGMGIFIKPGPWSWLKLESSNKVTVPQLAKKLRALNPTLPGCMTRGRVRLSKSRASARASRAWAFAGCHVFG